MTARHDVQYFPSSLSSFSPATSRVCRIPLTSGTSFIDPESAHVVQVPLPLLGHGFYTRTLAPAVSLARTRRFYRLGPYLLGPYLSVYLGLGLYLGLEL